MPWLWRATDLFIYLFSRRSSSVLSFYLHPLANVSLEKEESEREHASAHFKCTAFPRRVKAKGRPRCPLPYLRFAKRDSKFQSRHESRLFFFMFAEPGKREKGESNRRILAIFLPCGKFERPRGEAELLRMRAREEDSFTLSRFSAEAEISTACIHRAIGHGRGRASGRIQFAVLKRSTRIYEGLA